MREPVAVEHTRVIHRETGLIGVIGMVGPHKAELRVVEDRNVYVWQLPIADIERDWLRLS